MIEEGFHIALFRPSAFPLPIGVLIGTGRASHFLHFTVHNRHDRVIQLQLAANTIVIDAISKPQFTLEHRTPPCNQTRDWTLRKGRLLEWNRWVGDSLMSNGLMRCSKPASNTFKSHGHLQSREELRAALMAAVEVLPQTWSSCAETEESALRFSIRPWRLGR